MDSPYIVSCPKNRFFRHYPAMEIKIPPIRALLPLNFPDRDWIVAWTSFDPNLKLNYPILGKIRKKLNFNSLSEIFRQ